MKVVALVLGRVDTFYRESEPTRPCGLVGMMPNDTVFVPATANTRSRRAILICSAHGLHISRTRVLN
jgi:hypothetical protein